MTDEILFRRGTALVRRQRLAPGEALPWHRDPFHRVSVVLSGDQIRIEFRDGSETLRVPVKRGQVGWDEPLNRAHRAVNIGQEPYEEITIFFLDHPDAVPQPHDD
jgi:quercetin dioxygenase-like cupin family protein